MNKLVYNLEMKTVDKLGRAKTTKHIGMFDSMDRLEITKSNILSNNPNVKFEVHVCEHLFFEQRPA